MHALQRSHPFCCVSASRNFQHPNLVQLFGVVSLQKPLRIVTELMANGEWAISLTSFLVLAKPTGLEPHLEFALLCACGAASIFCGTHNKQENFGSFHKPNWGWETLFERHKSAVSCLDWDGFPMAEACVSLPWNQLYSCTLWCRTFLST